MKLWKGMHLAAAVIVAALCIMAPPGLYGLGGSEPEAETEPESPDESPDAGDPETESMPVPEDGEEELPTDPAIDESLLGELLDLTPGEARDAISDKSVPDQVRYALVLSQRSLLSGDRSGALEWAEWAEETAGEHGDAELMGDVLLTRSRISDLSGNVRAAVSQARRAASSYADAGLSALELNALATLANAQHRLGLLTDGIETADRVIERLDELEGVAAQGHVLANAAMMRYKIGRFSGLSEMLERAHELFEEAGDRDGIGTVYRIWGNYYGAQGDDETALDYYRRAATEYELTGNLHDYANVSFNTGLTKMRAGSHSEAVEYLEEAVDGFLEAGSISGAGMAATELSVALWMVGRPEEADSALASAIGMLEATQSLRRLARAYTVRSSIQNVIGDEEGARDSLREARNLYDELGLRDEADAIQRELDELGDDRDGGI